MYTVSVPAYSTMQAEPSLTDRDTPVNWDAAFDKAVKKGELPNSHLSRLIFKQRMRFPDAIVLTRVGKFYEVCYGREGYT